MTLGDGKCDAEVLGLGLNTSIELDDRGLFTVCAEAMVSEGAFLESICSSVGRCSIHYRDQEKASDDAFCGVQIRECTSL